MYDLAKRSLACTVATGGLLLTGAAFSPAMAAGGLGVTQGPAHAQEARGAVSAFAALDSATASGDAAAPAAPRGWAAPPDLLFPRFLTDGPAATRAYRAGAIPADSIFHLPIDLGRRLCDAARDALAERGATAGACAAVGDTPMQGQIITSPIVVCGDTVATGGTEGPKRRFTCATAEGSVPTVPDDPAPGTGGASATAGSTGLVSTPIQVPAAQDQQAQDQQAQGQQAQDQAAQNSPQNPAVQNPAGSGETVRGDDANEPKKASSMTRSAPLPAGHVAPAAARLPQGDGCDRGGWGEGRDEAGGMCTPSPHHKPTPSQTCTPPPPPTCTPTPTTPRTPPSSTPPATTPPATTPPATTPPATTPPATVPITPVGGPSSSTPPGTSSTTPGTSTTPPTGPATPSASASPNGGGLAHTGADIEIGLAAAAATLIAGLGLRMASRRRSARH